MSPKTTAMTALLAFALTAARVSAADLWLHIKIHDAGEDSHVNVNLPLSLVQRTAALIPSNARSSGRIRVNDSDVDIAELRQIWNEVRNSPDATYVTVEERDSRVRVAKRGEYLHIVGVDRHGRRGGGENVEVKIPVEVVSALLSGRGDEMNVSAAIQALARRGEGELVTVNGDDETVRIWVDATSETR